MGSLAGSLGIRKQILEDRFVWNPVCGLRNFLDVPSQPHTGKRRSGVRGLLPALGLDVCGRPLQGTNVSQAVALEGASFFRESPIVLAGAHGSKRLGLLACRNTQARNRRSTCWWQVVPPNRRSQPTFTPHRQPSQLWVNTDGSAGDLSDVTRASRIWWTISRISAEAVKTKLTSL